MKPPRWPSHAIGNMPVSAASPIKPTLMRTSIASGLRMRGLASDSRHVRPNARKCALNMPQTPPDATTPRINPYLPTGDTQAAQFALANPQWDGRGTTIAVLDSGIDLDTPALQTTTTGLP